MHYPCKRSKWRRGERIGGEGRVHVREVEEEDIGSSAYAYTGNVSIHRDSIAVQPSCTYASNDVNSSAYAAAVVTQGHCRVQPLEGLDGFFKRCRR